MRILFICIDRQLAEVITDCLSAQGHALEWMKQYEGTSAYRSGYFDAMIFVWSHSPASGMKWLRQLRLNIPQTPLLVVCSALDAAPVARELNALECHLIVDAGSSTMLATRISEVLVSVPAIGEEQFQCGGIHFDLRQRLVRKNGRPIALTDREWSVIEAMARESAGPISKSELASLVIENAEHPENAIEVHIASLRRKLGRELIETFRGRGYRLKR